LSANAADASEPIREKLDALCAELWGVDAKGLASVQFAYRELYVTAPKENAEAKEAEVVEA
jgi:hypothetical protein